MIGAIFGDIAGSVYEFGNTRDYNFVMLPEGSRPMDDTCMTLAVANALLDTYGKDDDAIHKAVVTYMQAIGRRYPNTGYGGRFRDWLASNHPQPYNSYGNGSGMRVSPVGWLYASMDETLHVAKLTAEVTHNHPEGIKGAQAVAAAIYLARTGADKEEIKAFIEKTFSYDLNRTLDEIRPTYRFYVDCMRSVPEAIIAFLEGNDYEDVIRRAISLGGDSDTIACMAGGIAEAYYGLPDGYREEVLSRLDIPLRRIVFEFEEFLEDGIPANDGDQ